MVTEPPGGRTPSVKAVSMFVAFVLKEAKHVLRDKRSLLILLGLPIVMMTLFGFALSNEVKNSNFVILDENPDASSIALADRIAESKYFTRVGRVAREEEIRQWFQRGDARLAVVFPARFDHDLRHLGHAQVHLIADDSDPNTASTVANYARAIVSQYQAELQGRVLDPGAIQVETRMLYNPQLKSSYMFVPGVMTLILMLLGAMMTSVSIVREKERGTMEVLLVSPMNPLILIIGKAVPYMVLCLLDVLIILALSYGLLDLPTGANIPLLIAESLLFIVTTLALGLVISNVVQQQQTAMFVSLVGLLMPSLVFSGFMFPIDNMPWPLQAISYVVPTRWFYLIASNVMIKHLGFSAIVQPTLVLGGMTLVLTFIALRKFKQRL